MRYLLLIACAALLLFTHSAPPRVIALSERSPQPRIESIVPADKQLWTDANTTIWFDDFHTEKKYREESGGREGPGFGGGGEAMVCLYEKGSQGVGNRKVFFGDAPFMCMARVA